MDKKILVSLTSTYSSAISTLESDALFNHLLDRRYMGTKDEFWKSSNYFNDTNSMYKATLYQLEDGTREVEYQKLLNGEVVAAMSFNFSEK
jgi:hypothetical protein